MISKQVGAPAHVVAADFLRARQWVGNCIAAASRGVTPPAYPTELDDVILDDLLKYERCAAWLVDGLTSNRFMMSLAASTVEVVRKAAMKETQSTMRALFDARELSSIATRLGIPVVVLKGGVRAITGSSPALPVVDIDVLVSVGKVDMVIAELEIAGFGKPRPKLAHHQGMEPANDHLSVEVHWSLLGDGLPVDPGVWDRKETIPNAPGLFSLGRTDSLVHVARHALENHRQRPVSLRDAILAGVIAESCSAEELETARSELGRRHNSGEALDIVSFGLRLTGRAEGLAEDPFIEKCAAFYATVALAPELPEIVSSAGALEFVADVAIGRAGFVRAARDSLKWHGSSLQILARAGENFPLVARPLSGLAHLAYYTIASAITLPRVRRTKDKALREFDRRNDGAIPPRTEPAPRW